MSLQETREFDVSIPPGGPRLGRTIKFTPERMDQIRNLVERGTSREAIAAIIGCTVGSLQVTCSKAGISLRVPRSGTSMTLPAKRQPPLLPAETIGGDNDNGNGNGHVLAPVTQMPKARGVSCVLRLRYGTHTYDLPLPLGDGTIAALALTAEMNGMRMGELIAAILNKSVGEITS